MIHDEVVLKIPNLFLFENGWYCGDTTRKQFKRQRGQSKIFMGWVLLASAPTKYGAYIAWKHTALCRRILG